MASGAATPAVASCRCQGGLQLRLVPPHREAQRDAGAEAGARGADLLHGLRRAEGFAEVGVDVASRAVRTRFTVSSGLFTDTCDSC